MKTSLCRWPAIFSLLTLCSFTFPASAAILVNYQFPSGNLAPTTIDSDFTASNTTFGSFNGLANGSATYGGSSSGNLFARVQNLSAARVAQPSAALAISTNSYFEFTLTPDPGVIFDLSSFTANVGAQRIAGVDTKAAYTSNFFVRSSLDGYSTDLGTQSYVMPSGSGAAGPFYNPLSITLGTGFSNIAAPVTFRVYVWADTVSPHLDQTLRIDDVTFNGAVVPEPATSGLFLVAALTSVVFRRRHA